MLLPASQRGLTLDGIARAQRGRRGHAVELRGGNAESIGGGLQPERGAFDAERKRSCQPCCAAFLKHPRRFAKKRLRQQEAGAGSNRRQLRCVPGREEAHRRDPQRRKKPGELVFDDVGERADDEK